MKFDMCIFFENLSRKFRFHENLTRIMGTLQENQYAFMIIPHSVFLRIGNVVEKIKTHILHSATFLNHAVYEMMWKIFYS